MSWDRYKFDEQSSCACGKGIVIKHCYREDDAMLQTYIHLLNKMTRSNDYGE